MFPSIEVHGRNFGKTGVLHIDIETLGLADERSSFDGQVHKCFLWDFPNSLIEIFKLLRNLPDILYRPIESN